ncbi:hypothetical protein PTE30175_02441 [Pandoraea terrae]|uniref:Uncharacterized protein n=1 Tax=Pandoraea terrae TaxID=1537710 RepID=A0A5E4V8X5_9BURK|nr:cytochrome oxidase small assembly protein [Pandoraea terrae]VVE08616.1 hypothetical protein PTE30175_02441 [Pandoraea terrae]
MPSLQGKSPSSAAATASAIRRRNLRTGLIFAAIAAAFFFGVMVKTKLMGM